MNNEQEIKNSSHIRELYIRADIEYKKEKYKREKIEKEFIYITNTLLKFKKSLEDQDQQAIETNINDILQFSQFHEDENILIFKELEE